LSFTVSIQEADFDLSTEVAALRAQDPGVGAVCCFIGTVRDFDLNATDSDHKPTSGSAAYQLSALELENYPGMTERSIQEMMERARARFGIHAARVIHRVGSLKPMDQIVLVAVTAAHRGASFQACEYLMDYLKTQAPFWKKEHTTGGPAKWVDARVSDDQAMARWQN
jgi:molybdopterin synthase catalytic subunit